MESSTAIVYLAAILCDRLRRSWFTGMVISRHCTSLGAAQAGGHKHEDRVRETMGHHSGYSITWFFSFTEHPQSLGRLCVNAVLRHMRCLLRAVVLHSCSCCQSELIIKGNEPT